MAGLWHGLCCSPERITSGEQPQSLLWAQGRGAVKLAPLRPRSGGERGDVKLSPLRRRRRGEGALCPAGTRKRDVTTLSAKADGFVRSKRYFNNGFMQHA
jgi:hypothetical protein